MKYELYEKIKAFSLLKKYADRLTEVPYDEIVDLLSNGIKEIPFPITQLHKGHFIVEQEKMRIINCTNILMNSAI